MEFLTRSDIDAVIPPWGGELAIQILPLLDFERLLYREPGQPHVAEAGQPEPAVRELDGNPGLELGLAELGEAQEFDEVEVGVGWVEPDHPQVVLGFGLSLWIALLVPSPSEIQQPFGDRSALGDRSGGINDEVRVFGVDARPGELLSEMVGGCKAADDEDVFEQILGNLLGY